LQQPTELRENAFLYFSLCNSMQDRSDALAIFVAVAEQQSFVEAARQLSRSPASVTRAVGRRGIAQQIFIEDWFCDFAAV
jgi:hypothetical protein